MELDELVIGFRRAIERAKDNGEQGEFFRKFPTGQCGHSSDMLTQYLIDNGVKNVDYVCGTYYSDNPDDPDNCQSHAWLVVNELVVDITADQFRNRNSPLKSETPVYIAPMSNYYQQFEVMPGGRHKHWGLQTEWSNYSDLKSWYKTILKYL